MNKFTVESFAKPTVAGLQGNFLPRSVMQTIPYDLDGTHCRKFLESCGYTVVSNRDTGSNGEAVTSCGLIMSTNGYIYRERDRKKT